MRENRPYGSEGGEPQLNAAFLPLSLCSMFVEGSATFGHDFGHLLGHHRQEDYAGIVVRLHLHMMI